MYRNLLKTTIKHQTLIKLETDIIGGIFHLDVSWIYFSHAKTSFL